MFPVRACLAARCAATTASTCSRRLVSASTRCGQWNCLANICFASRAGIRLQSVPAARRRRGRGRQLSRGRAGEPHLAGEPGLPSWPDVPAVQRGIVLTLFPCCQNYRCGIASHVGSVHGGSARARLLEHLSCLWLHPCLPEWHIAPAATQAAKFSHTGHSSQIPTMCAPPFRALFRRQRRYAAPVAAPQATCERNAHTLIWGAAAP